MANPAATIDQVLGEADGTDPNDPANDGRRGDLLNQLNLMNSYIHNYREWPWTFDEATLTIASGSNFVGVPTNFMHMGRNGALYDSANKRRWTEISIHQFVRMRFEMDPDPNSRCFVIKDLLVQIPWTSTSDIVFAMVYRVRPEILVDDGTEMLLPDQYAQTVLIPALYARAQMTKDDARPDWKADLKDGISQMCALENPRQTGVQRQLGAYRRPC